MEEEEESEIHSVTPDAHIMRRRVVSIFESAANIPVRIAPSRSFDSDLVKISTRPTTIAHPGTGSAVRPSLTQLYGPMALTSLGTWLGRTVRSRHTTINGYRGEHVHCSSA